MHYTLKHANISNLTQQKQTELPIQHLTSSEPLTASVVIASFGSSDGYNSAVFDVTVKHDPTTKVAKYEKPMRYGKLAEIHHIFRADPTSPPKIISLVFVFAVLATIPAVLISVSSPARTHSHSHYEQDVWSRLFHHDYAS